MKDEGRLDQLFAEALQKPAAARREFVSRTCGHDEALSNEILSLLAAADDSEAFMAAPALERLAADIARDGWAVRPGDRVGAYTILRLLGTGGAGQVWCAHDERLGREVAIKMLLPYLASDPDRVRRFADEARLAGALNHANILAVHDVGEHRGTPFLVSEYLEGDTLRARLENGPLPVDKAVAITLDIARGLAVAHARGIIHRDLKPENVLLKPDGGVKILDFGIAKLLLSSPGEGPQDAARTAVGAIVGTAGYMSPEQVTGGEVDTRSDLFALGALTYEMIGGHPPFRGATTFDTLQAVLTSDPSPLTIVNANVTDALSACVQRLLDKRRESRFQSAADLVWALERLPATSAGARRAQPAGTAPSTPLRRWLPWIASAAAVAATALATWMLASSRDAAPSLSHPFPLTWSLPAGISLDSAPLVSPDSLRIALVGTDATGGSRIFVRDLTRLEPVPVAGTEGAKQPFWSPDSKSLGYFANGMMMRVAIDGGAPVPLAPAPDARGASWSRSGTIIFQPDFRDSGLSRISDAGGRVEPVTAIDSASSDVAHRWPAFLPDDVHFLYLVVSTDEKRRGVYLGSIDALPSAPPSVQPSRLFASSSGPVYVPLPGSGAGLLLSAENRWIEVRTFDTTRLAVTGDVHKIDVAAAGAGPHHSALLSASNAVLAFASSPIPYGAHVATMMLDGTGLQLWPERELGGFLRLSPLEDRLARARLDAIAGNPDIWIDDLKRGVPTRITTARDLDVLPVWSRDANRIAYRSGTNAAPTLRVAAADGTGAAKTIRCPRPYCEPTDWSPDNELIVNVSGGDVWAVPIDERASPRPILHESFVERDARISPNGLWIAYVSENQGHPEVMIRTMSGLERSGQERQFAVSKGGGDQPVWRRDGSGLFYVDTEGFLHAVSVAPASDGGLTLGAVRRLSVPAFAKRHWGTEYDVSSEGRIYFPHPGNETSPHDIGVVLGWRGLLK